MDENNPDMSNVAVGTRVQYRNGRDAVVTRVSEHDVYPFCTDNGIHHEPDGRCCVKTWSEYDIVKVLSWPVGSAAAKPGFQIAWDALQAKFKSIVESSRVGDGCKSFDKQAGEFAVQFNAFQIMFGAEDSPLAEG